MQPVEPGGAGVVKIGEGALFQHCLSSCIDGQQAVWIACDDLWLATDKIRRIQPGLALFVKVAGGRSDGLSTRVVRVIGGGDVGGQAFGKGKGFE